MALRCIVTIAVLIFASASAEKLAAQSRLPIYQGFTEPSKDILLSTSEIGEVVSVNVKTGDPVAKGQTLFELDRQRQEAAARLSELQAKMSGEIQLAEAEVDLHRRRTKKLEELVEAGAARKEEWLRSRSALASAFARLQIATEQQNNRQQQFDRDQLLLDRRSIRSPIDGVVGQVLREAGESVTPADSALMRLVVLDPLAAELNLPAKEAAQIRVGDSLPIFLQNSQATVRAVVAEISPTIDKESGTTIVRLNFPNPGLRFKAGDQCTLDQLPQADSPERRNRDQVMVPMTKATTGSATDVSVRPPSKPTPWRPGSTRAMSGDWVGGTSSNLDPNGPTEPSNVPSFNREVDAPKVRLVRRPVIALDRLTAEGSSTNPTPAIRSIDKSALKRVPESKPSAGASIEIIRPNARVLRVPRNVPNPLRGKATK